MLLEDQLLMQDWLEEKSLQTPTEDGVGMEAEPSLERMPPKSTEAEPTKSDK